MSSLDLPKSNIIIRAANFNLNQPSTSFTLVTHDSLPRVLEWFKDCKVLERQARLNY